MTDDDKFWQAVEKISQRYNGNPDDTATLKALRALGCDKETAAELLEGMK